MYARAGMYIWAEKFKKNREEETYKFVDYNIWCGFPKNIAFVTIS